mgnify:CR=1 FL=1
MGFMKNAKTKNFKLLVTALVFLLIVIDYIIIFFPFKYQNKYNYSVNQTNIELKSDVYDVKEITQELEKYTSDYCKYDMEPIYGSYELTDHEGTAIITFINKDNKRRNSLEFNIDTYKKCVTSVKQIKGYALKSYDYSGNSFEYDGKNIYDKYQQCLKENPDCRKAYFFLSDSNIDVIPVYN